MIKLLIIPALGVAATACVATTQGRLGARAGGPDIAAADAAPDAHAGGGEDPGPDRAPDEDEHWFTGEDYLVSQKPYEGEPRRWIRQGKMLSRPTATTKTEAHFLLANGKELWTAHYWRTRVAVDKDLSIGALVFCPQSDGRAPASEERARRAVWLIGAVTDVSDLFKGMVAVGSKACEVRALRVPIE